MIERTSGPRAPYLRALAVAMAVTAGFGTLGGGSAVAAEEEDDVESVVDGGAWAAGWALADDPGSAAYTPSLDSQYNSSGAINTATRSGVGRYVVTFPGLGRNGGIAHVTPFSSAPMHCAVVAWVKAGADELVEVQCFDGSSVPSDSKFVVAFTNAKAGTFGGDVAYAWANQESAPAEYKAAGRYQFNSAGGTIKVTRTEVGGYVVRIPNLGEQAGTVKVTSYGATPNRCHVRSWGPSGQFLQARVWCVDAADARADTRFTITYTDHQNLFATNNLWDGYLWADESSRWYTPDLRYSYNVVAGAAENEVIRVFRGLYDVELPGLLTATNKGTVQVTTIGTPSDYCHPMAWGQFGGDPSSLSIRIRCFDAAGEWVNSRFTVQYTTTQP